MKPLAKWTSIIAVSVAMIILLYYMGVVNSGISLGVALLVIGAIIIAGTFLVPGPKK